MSPAILGPRFRGDERKDGMHEGAMTMTVAVKPTADPAALAVVDDLIRRARKAMAQFADADQARVDPIRQVDSR